MNRKEYWLVLAIVIVFIVAFILIQLPRYLWLEQDLATTCSANPQQSRIVLPAPDFKGKTLEDAIAERRSVRYYSSDEMTLEELSILLWAGNGITSSQGLRSAPSAGGLYPIDLYVVPNRVEGASCGIYRYDPQRNELLLETEGNFTERFYNISYGQSHVKNAAVLIVLVATPEKNTEKYGEEGRDFILIESGHIAQNILLEAVSLGLGAVPIGGFDKNRADELMKLDESRETIYLVAAGK